MGSWIRKVERFVRRIPKVPSHYCRKTSNKLYLEPHWNLSKLHRAYLSEFPDESYHVSLAVFNSVFKNWTPSLAFFISKKDRCTTCLTSSPEDPKYLSHISRKNNIRKMKEDDKEMARNSNNKMIYLTFDMEAILSLPYGQASSLYYSRKLSVFNFTIFDSKQNGICNVFDETNGSKGSTEVASCLLDYFESLDEEVEHVVMYSDTNDCLYFRNYLN